MAAVINKRDIALQAASPRTVTVNLGSTVNVNGTLDGTPVADVVTAAFSGSGTDNFFTSSASDPTGGASGDAHYNTTTQVMWFNVAGTWTKGGTVNASQIITGTLAAARIAAGSITADKIAAGSITATELAANSVTSSKISVSTLSAIAANLGTVSAGSISGSANIDITGTANFQGATNSGGVNYCGVFNEARTVPGGVSATAGSNGFGVRGSAGTAGDIGVSGTAGTASGAEGVRATGNSGQTALGVVGTMTMSSTTLVSNLNADMVDGKHASSLCQIVTTNAGTCTVAGNGFQLNVTGSLASTVQTRGTSNIVYIENISDARLKQDIEDEKYGLDFINSLSPRSFRMRANPSLLSHGFIYQEVAELLDSDSDTLACLNNDGTGSVDYNGLIAPLVKAVQELSKQLQEVKNEQKACRCCK